MKGLGAREANFRSGLARRSKVGRSASAAKSRFSGNANHAPKSASAFGSRRLNATAPPAEYQIDRKSSPSWRSATITMPRGSRPAGLGVSGRGRSRQPKGRAPGLAIGGLASLMYRLRISPSRLRPGTQTACASWREATVNRALRGAKGPRLLAFWRGVGAG